MEWVIAVLAIGCLFFAFQIIMDYIKHKAVVGPRIQRLEGTRTDLEKRIETAKGQLEVAQDQLGPAREEVEELEQSYLELQEQIQAERAKTRRRSPLVDGDER
ncbi:MAG: hypothetical protein ACKVJG_14045 [Candidatus Latescibacterota bacterium]|jgi:predicted  nucleic acid-binding Zn-ribbon protein|tara:strand:+ start:140 stop:448 length:309 start_codon:yes stop_codon:yes gene_type:complete